MNNFVLKLILLALVLGAGYFFVTGMGDKDEKDHDDDAVESWEIYPGDVSDKIKNNEDIILLDVRTPEEFEEIHLENAFLLPVERLSQQSLTDIGLGTDMKDREIIIYCRSGNRSKVAYDIMNSLGYTNIKSIAGGMVHWQEDNYPYTEAGIYEGGNFVTGEPIVSSGDGAKIVLDESFYDFGDFPQSGGIAKHTFEVKNEGTENLIIGDITTSCGCTSATITSKVILPGEKADLTVSFDPNFHKEPSGVLKRTVFIPTNDKTNPEVEVVIQVDVVEGE